MPESTASEDEVIPERQKHLRGVVDKALNLQTPVVERHIARARQRKPEASPSEILHVLEKQYRSALIMGGGAVGAAAAVPAVGTAASVALSGGEALSQMELTVLFVLSVAQVHGVRIDEVERRRMLVLAVVLGGGSSETIGKIAGRTGPHWAKEIINKVPHSRLLQINAVLGRNFVTMYGTRQGIIVLGRVLPFGIGAGIGAGAGAVTAEGAIRALRSAFGPAPKAWAI